MEKACYGSPMGPFVTAEEFHDKATVEYKELGIYPYCRACEEIVDLYGVHSPRKNRVTRFDHKDRDENADPLDDCILANRNARYRGMGPSAWDEERGKVLREQFYAIENKRIAYAFCHAMCKSGSLSGAKFNSMLRRADKKRIWYYADIPLWVIPYILLTLENFEAKSITGKIYGFHFSFKKPRATTASALWEQSAQCEFRRLFTSDGSLMTSPGNPYELSEEFLLSKAGNTDWIKDSFLERLFP